jgi:hypothetical protein
MNVYRFGWFCDHGDQTRSIWQPWVLSVITFQFALKTSSPVAFGISSRRRQLDISLLMFAHRCQTFLNDRGTQTFLGVAWKKQELYGSVRY